MIKQDNDAQDIQVPNDELMASQEKIIENDGNSNSITTNKKETKAIQEGNKKGVNQHQREFKQPCELFSTTNKMQDHQVCIQQSVLYKLLMCV